MENNGFDYTCLFGGGAIRGAAHVGVIKALEELGIKPNTLCGSSVGSIIAVLYAIGYNVEELKQIFLSVNFELFRDISFGFNKKFALSKGDIFLDWLRELIEQKFYGENYSKGNNKPVKFKNLSKNLIIITTNIKDFSCCEFSTFETPDFEIAMAVRISCCMPGLMRAVNIDNKLLVDGDLMKGKPMWSLSKNLLNNKERILEIRLEGTFSGTDENPVEYVNGMYSCMTSSETDFIKKIYKDCDKYDYLTINTGDVVVVDFNYPEDKRNQIINNGYTQTIDYFKNTLVNKKKKLKQIYNQINNKISLAYHLFLRKKYINSKNNISELYILLADTNKVIDKEIYNNINMLQKLLFNNVTSGLLGNSKCKNAIVIKNLFEQILENLKDKNVELDEYIKLFDNKNCL